MYTADVRICGVVPLLQHRFAPSQLTTLTNNATRRTGAIDYSSEWLDSIYATQDGYLFQPATHIEGSLVRAAASFRIKGARGKTWKDPVRAYCYVLPEQIVHLHNGQYVRVPDQDLLTNPTDHLSVSVMRVIVQRSAVARLRLQIAAGWELSFQLEVHDDQVRPDVIHQILVEAGRAVGIGDFRPRYGRFKIVDLEVKT